MNSRDMHHSGPLIAASRTIQDTPLPGVQIREGVELSLGKCLALYRTSADGGFPTIDVELVRLVRSRDGSVRLVFRGLAGPPGVSEAEASIERPE